MWWTIAFLSAFHPPTGSAYQRNFTIPVLGPQHMRIRILTETRALIYMDGALVLQEEEFEYALAGNGELVLELGPRTKRLLRKYRTSLRQAAYHPKTDHSSVVVDPPMVPPIRIDLYAVE